MFRTQTGTMSARAIRLGGWVGAITTEKFLLIALENFVLSKPSGWRDNGFRGLSSSQIGMVKIKISDADLQKSQHRTF